VCENGRSRGCPAAAKHRRGTKICFAAPGAGGFRSFKHTAKSTVLRWIERADVGDELPPDCSFSFRPRRRRPSFRNIRQQGERRLKSAKILQCRKLAVETMPGNNAIAM